MILRRPLPLALILALAAAPALAADGVKTAGAPPLKKPVIEKKADAPKDEAKPEKKGKAAAKKKKAPESKYKTTAITESTENNYRFDSEGNPVGTKKKSAAKPAKKSSSESDAKPEGKCSQSEESCSDKPSEADAL